MHGDLGSEWTRQRRWGGALVVQLVSYRLQEAMQLQGLAEKAPPPGDLRGEVVTEVLELLTLGVDGVYSIVPVLNQLLAFQRQGSGLVHSHLQDTSRESV